MAKTNANEIQIASLQARRDRLAELAREVGFDAFGVTSPQSIPDAPSRLREFLQKGYHGEMGWLEDREHQRSSPSALWPDVKSVIALGQNYGPTQDPLTHLKFKSKGLISAYAGNRDYHDVLKKRLKTLARLMVHEFGGELKVFVDTAPVMEKPLAQAAGLGWQGKHTNVVSREFGSWLFLGIIYTTLDLGPDPKENDHCGNCSKCLDICPTDAFPGPYQIDARRCISYLTIEKKGVIPHEFRKSIGNRIYGCDDCLAVCPWNKFAQVAKEAKLQAREDLVLPDLEALAELDNAEFRKYFSGSPIKRIGRDRFIRNVMIAIGNSSNPNLAASARRRLADSAEIVRGSAVWALQQLLDQDELAQLKSSHLATEISQAVRGEWDAFAAASE